jgi:hypothetical protein
MAFPVLRQASASLSRGSIGGQVRDGPGASQLSCRESSWEQRRLFQVRSALTVQHFREGVYEPLPDFIPQGTP